MRNTWKTTAGAAAVAVVLAGTAACGGGSNDGDSSGKAANLKVVYAESGGSHALSDLFNAAKTQYEKDHPGGTVTLQPIDASSADYRTKVALMQRSPSTAPDVVYEDSFEINADSSAGYLASLDDYVKSWPDWSQYSSSIRAQGTATDGHLYAVPLATDTQGIWYNKKVFQRAGLPADWQPKTWNDILTAARALKKLPGVTPMNVYVTKAQDEQTTLRGVENLISGTPGGLDATLYDSKTGKWVSNAQGMLDALTFLHTAYTDGLLPSVADMENPQLWNMANDINFPAGKLGMMFDGSWIYGGWQPKDKGGTNPWPTWTTDAGWAAIPTQNGAAPGVTSMSGGWTLAVSAKSKHQDAAFDFLKDANTKANTLAYVVASGNLPPRTDVRDDPKYTASNPSAEFFAKLVDNTHFRPSLPVYPQVSILIMEAAETATVGKKDPQQAFKTYNDALGGTVGADKVQQGATS